MSEKENKRVKKRKEPKKKKPYEIPKLTKIEGVGVALGICLNGTGARS